MKSTKAGLLCWGLVENVSFDERGRGGGRDHEHSMMTKLESRLVYAFGSLDWVILLSGPACTEKLVFRNMTKFDVLLKIKTTNEAALSLSPHSFPQLRTQKRALLLSSCLRSLCIFSVLHLPRTSSQTVSFTCAVLLNNVSKWRTPWISFNIIFFFWKSKAKCFLSQGRMAALSTFLHWPSTLSRGREKVCRWVVN